MGLSVESMDMRHQEVIPEKNTSPHLPTDLFLLHFGPFFFFFSLNIVLSLIELVRFYEAKMQHKHFQQGEQIYFLPNISCFQWDLMKRNGYKSMNTSAK